MERYIRGNGKWVKISGGAKRWAMAKGWEGKTTADCVLYFPTLAAAVIAANNWIDGY